MSVLHTLFPALIDMMTDKTTGTINLTNPGVISHNEILEMYREIGVFTPEEISALGLEEFHGPWTASTALRHKCGTISPA